MRLNFSLDIENELELFTHKDSFGVYRTFPIEAMFKFAETMLVAIPNNKIVHCSKLALSRHIYEDTLKSYGIERPRVDRLKEPFLSKPLLGVFLENTNESKEAVTIIDGNHRVIKLFEEGESEVMIYGFRPPAWKMFLLPLQNPEEKLHAPSGFVLNESGTVLQP